MKTRFNNNNQARNLARQIANMEGNGSAKAIILQTALNEFRTVTGVNWLAKATQADLDKYAEHIVERHELDLATGTARNRISALSSAMQTLADNHIINGPAPALSADKHGITREVDVANKANSRESAAAFDRFLKEKADQGNSTAALYLAIKPLQTELGLRLRESIAIKIGQKDPQAVSLSITEKDCPKNSRPREIAITKESQRAAIKNAQAVSRSIKSCSMTPMDLSLDQFKEQLRALKDEFRRATGHAYHNHGERHEYAHNRYTDLWLEKTGHAVQCPAVMGLGGRNNRAAWRNLVADQTGLTNKAIRELDDAIRRIVSSDLGHVRPEITLTYLG